MTSLLENSEAQSNECRVLPKKTTSQKHFLDLPSALTYIKLMIYFHQYFLVKKENKFLIGPNRDLFSVLSIGKIKTIAK